MARIHQVEALGRKKGEWVWCLNCERCYQVGEYRIEGRSNLQLCPYPGCSGDTVIDSWTWKQIRKDHPDYPEVPDKNKVYPLYG